MNTPSHPDAPEGFTEIGRPLPRREDRRLVTGTGRYLDDVVVPGCLHATFVRSPHAHARILSIDTSAAKAMPGVEAVVTCDDVPGVDNYGVFVSDQPVLARGKGVILQRYRAGHLADVRVFRRTDGLTWRSGRGVRCETNLDVWLGRRGQGGHSVPRGFPASNRFG